MRLLGLISTVLGLVLVILSFVWLAIFPPESRWSEEQAKAHSDASAKLHQLQHTVGGHSHANPSIKEKPNSPPATKADLEAARRRFEESNAALNAAKGDGKRTSWWLRGSGAALAAIGIAVLAFKKDRVAPRHSPGES